jgi:hypothetical protein
MFFIHSKQKKQTGSNFDTPKHPTVILLMLFINNKRAAYWSTDFLIFKQLQNNPNLEIHQISASLPWA